MGNLEKDHLDKRHEKPLAGCDICEKDALILYQQSMIKMVEDSYVDLVNSVDRVLKGVHAYHKTNQPSEIIPYGQSTQWVTIESGILPLECEEVDVMIKVLIDNKDSRVMTQGFVHKGDWKSWASTLLLKDVVAWRKIRGQADVDGYDTIKRKHKMKR